MLSFTAFALSWSGLSGFRNSANADPAPIPLIIAIPNAATPKATHQATGGHAAVGFANTESEAKAGSDAKAEGHTETEGDAQAEGGEANAEADTEAPKPKPTHTPKPKRLYVHTPRYVHKPQYPPAAPPVTIHGVLAGAAGRNYIPR